MITTVLAIALLPLLLLLRYDLGGCLFAVWLVYGPVGALAFYTAVSHPLAAVACLEPPPSTIRVGAAHAQL